jgi:hypothetical protein
MYWIGLIDRLARGQTQAALCVEPAINAMIIVGFVTATESVFEFIQQDLNRCSLRSSASASGTLIGHPFQHAVEHLLLAFSWPRSGRQSRAPRPTIATSCRPRGARGRPHRLEGIFRHHPELDAREPLRHSGARLTRRRVGHDTG